MSAETRPSWHADAHGRCHEKCEAYSGITYHICGINNLLPWRLTGDKIDVGNICPFAILATVLGCHGRTT
jgi:hypothetical protein